MKAHHFALLYLYLLCTTSVFSQNLELTFKKSMRSVEAGNFIEIEMPRPDDKKCKRCLLPTITGEFISFDGEFLKMQVLESLEKIIVDGTDAGYHFKRYTEREKGAIVEIPVRDVLSIKAKGKNKFQRQHPGDVVGNVFGWLAIVGLYMISTEGESDRTFNYIVALTATTYAIVSLSFRQSRFITDVDSYYFRGKKKVWATGSGIKSNGA